MRALAQSAGLLALAAIVLGRVSGHTRLECPPPRSETTGAKQPPCDAPDDPALPPFPLRPGLNTITWLESIGHPGAAGRVALSLDGVDDGFESCILLDHVPHDERSRPAFSNPRSFHRSSITLYIPDIQCERCTLQFMTFMTDDYHGIPEGSTCAYGPAQDAGHADQSLTSCQDVYHSCAPVSINGSVPRSQHTCSLSDYAQELDWPFLQGKSASTYFFKGAPGLYDSSSAQLLSGGSPISGCTNPTYCDPAIHYNKVVDVPPNAKYASLQGACAPVVYAPVEAFELGKVSWRCDAVSCAGCGVLASFASSCFSVGQG